MKAVIHYSGVCEDRIIVEADSIIKPIVATLPLGYHSEFASAINSIPIAEPKVGRWKPYLPEYGDMFKCSVCEEVIRLPYKPMRMPYNYCPMCGAKMEGE